MGGVCVTYGGDKRCIQSFVGKTRCKRPHRRRWRKWADNIKTRITEIKRKAWIRFIWLRTGESGVLFEGSDEALGSIKCGKLL